MGSGLLIAPEGIEIRQDGVQHHPRFRLLIAPEGIEIRIFTQKILT